MSNIKISSDLFLGTPELNRFQKFLSNDGYIRDTLANSVSFGLIKNDLDASFNNAKVTSDSDLNEGGNNFKTIKISPIKGIDKNGNYLYKDVTRQIPVPSNDRWYWVQISHEFSHVEKGVWSISKEGVITGVNGELTKIARGQPNFPTRVRFLNSQKNAYDFDILSITNDNNGVLSGFDFKEEDNLQLAVVGTFTYGSPIQPSNKLIFNYDSCKIELIQEDINRPNFQPTIGTEKGRTFFISRVKSNGVDLIIQDKRSDFWETKASYKLSTVDYLSNPLIGIESIKFDHPFSPQDKNIVDIAWSFRSTNWSINTETNTVTLSNGLGGKYKSINDFSNGDFNGWRLYTEDGKYSKIISSEKQGNAIDLKVDVLNIDSYSNDGGITFLQNSILNITPDSESIEIVFIPDVNDNVSFQKQTFEFDINTTVGKCFMFTYKDINEGNVKNIGGNYSVQYRYRNNSAYSSYRVIPSDSSGYYGENAFDESGNFVLNPETFRKPFVSSSTRGFIKPIISPKAYKNINQKVDKGDLIGVKNVTVLNESTYNLIVGKSLNTLYFTGDISLNSDLTIQLSSTNIVNGNSFEIHFNCNSIITNGYGVNIIYGSNIKSLNEGDFYMMKNIDGGIKITAKSDGNSWYLSQNYNLGTPNEIITLDGVISTMFKNGWGNIRGLYGYALCDGSVVGSPNLSQRFIVGQDSTNTEYITGTTGGEEKVKLQTSQNAPHAHEVDITSYNELVAAPGSSGSKLAWWNTKNETIKSAAQGEGEPHENRPPYYALIFAKKMF